MQKNWILTAGGVIVVLLIVIVIFAARGVNQVQTPVPVQQQPTQPEVVVNSLSVSDQPSGMSVAIESVDLKENGYVVIHEDEAGKAAKVIGNSKLLEAGSYSNLEVSLTRESKDDEVLYAMLHSDDGDGSYGFPDEDFPLKDEQDNVVLKKFIIGKSEEAAKPSTAEVTITYTDDGFSPAEATVSSGGKVTWINNSSKELQVGSAIHPIHSENREISGGKFTLDISPGESATVTLTKKGTWGYHAHLKPSAGGRLIVQ